MTEQDTHTDPYCGLTPLPRDQWPDGFDQGWLGQPPVYFGKIENRHLVCHSLHLGRSEWGLYADEICRRWHPTPEAALEAVGLDPSLLDQMRRRADQPADPEPQPDEFRCKCGWSGDAIELGDYVLRNGLGAACPKCSSVAYRIDPVAKMIHKVEALAVRLHNTPLKDISHDDVSDAVDALRTINVLNARIAELEVAVEPLLARHQPCGCVVCTCEDEIQCHGCGAKSCGTHPTGEIPNPVYEPTWQGQLAQAAAAERAKCVAELRARQRDYERLRDQSPSEREADDYNEVAVGYMLAADRLETNGREQG